MRSRATSAGNDERRVDWYGLVLPGLVGARPAFNKQVLCNGRNEYRDSEASGKTGFVKRFNMQIQRGVRSCFLNRGYSTIVLCRATPY